MSVEPHPIPEHEARHLIQLQRSILAAALKPGEASHVVAEVCRLAEPLLPDSVGTVLLLNAEGRLDVFAAPSMPVEAHHRLSGLQPGPEAGSCGNVIHRQEPVFVGDTLNDPRWRQLRTLAMDLGIKASWSMPIRDHEDKVIGSFALSSFAARDPSPFYVRVLEIGAEAVAFVLEHHRIMARMQTQGNALAAISEGVLISGVDEKAEYINPAFTEITGFALTDMLGHGCSLLRCPPTSAENQARIRAVLRDGRAFRGEILCYRKDGGPFWNDLTISPVRDDTGAISHFVSVLRDVTHRKEDEENLRVADKAFDVLDEAIIIADDQRRIVRVNPAFTRWTGYTAEEVVGKTPAILQSGRQDRAFYQTMWETIRDDGVWHGEIWNRRKDGEIYPERLTVAALTDQDRRVTHYVGSFVEASRHKEQEKKLRRLAMYDDLTDLPNRRLLQSHLEQAMARSLRHETLLAVCMLDLDGFKPVNDLHGHEAGDQVLVVLGKRLPDSLRKTDLVARMGGDEFVLLIEDFSGMDDLVPILDKVHAAITDPIVLANGATIQVGTSMGVYLYPYGEEETGDQLLRRADQALYESKSHKDDRDRYWAIFGEQVRKTQRTHAQRLLDAGALVVWYQPILGNKSGKVEGIEALARLLDDDGRILFPGEFLPQLTTEYLSNLSRMVLTQALADLTRLDEMGLGAPLWVSFNVDPKSFCGTCVNCLRGVVEASGVEASRITLEILESNDFLERERDAALTVLRDIKAIGIRLALDDVGSAYASLLRLKELPIDEIKLDQNFVQTLEGRPHDLHFVRVIQDLAMELKVDLVVEGVETEDILDAMMTTGVPHMQGYAISRPLPFDALRDFLSVPRSRDAALPGSLFGYYAGTMASHSSIKKMFMINASELDIDTLGNSRLCRGHGVQQRLGYGDDSKLARLHDDYHDALGLAARNAADQFRNRAWDSVEEKLEIFLAYMLDEWRRRKG